MIFQMNTKFDRPLGEKGVVFIIDTIETLLKSLVRFEYCFDIFLDQEFRYAISDALNKRERD